MRLTEASLRESKQNSGQKSTPPTAMKFMTLHQTQRLGIQPPATLENSYKVQAEQICIQNLLRVF